MAIDRAKAITPPDLLGIDRKITFENGSIILVEYKLV